MQIFIPKHVLYILLSGFVLFAGCDSTPAKPGVWKGNDIPADKAKMLHQLNDDLFKAIKIDRDDAEAFFSPLFLEQARSKVLFDRINRLRNDDEYTLLKDYYVVNEEISKNGLKAADHNELYYVPIAKEMYLACFIPKHKQNKQMITIVYGKYDIGWKANNIDMGYYTQQGKTGTELYELAKEEYANGHLLNAINNISLASNCLNASVYIKEPKSKEIKEFFGKLIDEANAGITYPIVLTKATSKPAVISISSNSTEDGFTQYIYYLTNLSLTDSAALKNENEQVKQFLPQIFPGIDKGKKTILYCAMRERPKAGKSIEHVDYKEEINN